MLRQKLLDILSGSRQQRTVEIETLIYESNTLKRNGLDAALRLLARDDLARAAETYLRS